jgi:hypothetical protein
VSAQAVQGIALADFRERTRRYSFFVTLLFAAFLGYETATGRILIQLDSYRGVYTSGWIGALMAMVVTSFVSLIGFYVVKNCVERDRLTGVGQVLATTPLSKAAYAVGKWASNFAVLSSIVFLMAVAAIIMQFAFGEDRRIDLWALLSPFFLLALPAMSVTAGIAVLFEMFPGLRGGAGNVVWFFIWTFTLTLPAIAKSRTLDLFGLAAVMNSLSEQARLFIPGYHGGMAFQIQVDQNIRIAEGLRWQGVSWTAAEVALRVAWLGAGILAALLGSLVFDRFDGSARRIRDLISRAAADGETAVMQPVPPARRAYLTSLRVPARANAFAAFAHTVRAEWRLATRGHRWWWYVIAAGLLVAQFTTPWSTARGPILALAWIWPTLLWSGLGAREIHRGTQQVIFSCPDVVKRQVPASWIAGILIALVCGLGVGMRAVWLGDRTGLLAWLAGAIFVPSLALALGVWSGTSKFFEGLYTAVWYVGPMNHEPGFDYTGSAGGPVALHYAEIYLALSGVLICLALARRHAQVNTRD